MIARVTFGVQYSYDPHPTHPDLVHPDGWLEIEAPSYKVAREITVALFGRAWSQLYDESEMTKRIESYFPRGCLGRFCFIEVDA